MFSGWIIFTAIALVLWGLSGVTQKLATNHISSQLSFIWFAVAMIVISLIVALSEPIHWRIGSGVMLLAICGGVLNGLGALTSFCALESGGKASVVISLVALYPLLTVAIAVAFLHEALTGRQVVGIVLAIIVAILLSLDGEQQASAGE